MPIAAISPERWEAICEIYQHHAGPSLHAARDLGWPAARTRRVWNRGYPSQGLPPVKTVVASTAEKVAAIRAGRAEIEARERAQSEAMTRPSDADEAVERAGHNVEVVQPAEQRRIEMMLRRESDREKARQDAIKSRSEEAALVSHARRNSLALNVVTAQILRGAQALAGRIQLQLEREATSDKPLTIAEQLALVRQAAAIARFNSEAAMMAVKTERMVLGTSEQAESSEPNGSLEEAAQWIESSVKAVQRARQRGMLVIVAGEQTPTVAHGRVAPGPQPSQLPEDATEPDDDDDDESEGERAELPTAKEQAKLGGPSDEVLRARVRKLTMRSV